MMLLRDRTFRNFFGCLIGVLLLWFLVYDLWLAPDGRLDAWMASAVAGAARTLLGAMGLAAGGTGRTVVVGDAAGIFVDDGCNGLATVGLILGFVLAYPGRNRRRAWFLPLAALSVIVVNLGRVTSLAWLQNVHPAWFENIYAWGATTFFYAVTVVLWAGWAHLNRDVGVVPIARATPVSAAPRARPA